MIKTSEMIVVVDSVESAIKFYTEKLGFDIADMSLLDQDNVGTKTLSYASVKKGKCIIHFRVPSVEELAEFSFIKRCPSRSVGLYLKMKKGLERYFQRCKKKGVTIVSEITETKWGDKIFAIKDPFGVKLTFAQPIKGFVKPRYIPNFYGLAMNPEELLDKSKDKELLDKMANWLKIFGILRRAAKKYSKLWLKKYRSENQ